MSNIILTDCDGVLLNWRDPFDAYMMREKGIFAEGWLKNENASGRPADILFTNKGHMLISDDLSGNIYIIKYLD